MLGRHAEAGARRAVGQPRGRHHRAPDRGARTGRCGISRSASRRCAASAPTVVQLPTTNLIRTAYFCSGCPHNTSTRTIEGSMAFTGVGCYGLVPMLMPDRKTEWAAQMGAEGSLWVGLQSFVDVPHAFQNLGDGTYFHSGHPRRAAGGRRQGQYDLQAALQRRGRDDRRAADRRPALRRGHGQPALLGGRASDRDRDGRAGEVPGDRQLAEGHDDPAPQGPRARPEGAAAGQGRLGSHLRPDLRCGEAPAPQARHSSPIPRSASSSTRTCARAAATATRSRTASACSRSTPSSAASARSTSRTATRTTAASTGSARRSSRVHGGGPRKGEAASTGDELGAIFAGLPAPAAVPLADVYNVLITGIGGTGVLTVGAILGMAAHLDGKACSVMDITGMAQKGGAVVTHLRFGASRDKLFATRLWENSADLVIGCDLVVTTERGDARPGARRHRAHRRQQRRRSDGAVPVQPGDRPEPGPAARRARASACRASGFRRCRPRHRPST